MKTSAKLALHGLFSLGQKLGVDVLPRHFYSQIPDLAAMRRETAWRAPMPMTGVLGAAIEGQVAFLDHCAPAEISAVLKDRDVHAQAVARNGDDGGYGPIEADFLYAFIRTWKPRRVVQVGCGVSTAVIQAAGADAGYAPAITCIDPYPTAFLKAEAAQGRIELIPVPAQVVGIEAFTGLEAGDLLFIDSTHAVRPGSEVNRVVLDVLPRMAPGVFAHFHDIYFPYDYPRRLLTEDLFFHAESTLVHAFLVGNPRCRIEAALSMLHYAAPEALARRFPRYDPQGNADGLAAGGGRHFPSALWLRFLE
ncbi:MAG TPA: class I SAM-dependent methyltransferase [Caulobacter sp.]|nr:class I SAM-dependent methyltransferase [Caulobacter sp.]